MATANRFKNGEVAVTLAVKIICRVIKRFGAKLNQAIDDAVTAGQLTAPDGATLKNMLVVVQAACDIWRGWTHY